MEIKHKPKSPQRALAIAKKAPEIPSIRNYGTIEVNFSERRFVTPQRESQEAAEQEWILKQNRVKKDVGMKEHFL